ncbi:PhoX family protein [Nocardioides coralli]|uniref:PhoX family protein n=1 Tax=Nocardioides coralli TaxID=2872154 RepID=UPI001CA3FD19|nr:alkaline phosphatase PhoX [Nocardioides coralli]QZY29656.1 PhoX family protein [Nocardioides coralli]
MTLDRRTLLKTTAAGAAAGPFAGLVAAPAHADPDPTRLVPVKDKRDGVVRLHLPRGFRYRSFHDTEQPVTLTDGTSLPGFHDGMAAFDGPGKTVLLVRNHEVNKPQDHFGPGRPYDAMAGGGTTTVQVTKKGKVIRSFTSLNGTMMNCSGGPMPWGSWITCEETVNGPDVGPDFTGTSNVPLEQRHGYVYEVPASRFPGRGQSNRRPIRSAGRFAHEAVAFDPEGGCLYLTEDNFGFASGFYRYTPPNDPMEDGYIADRGKLHMLKVRGVDNAHLEGHQVQGTVYDVEWVEIDEPDVEYPYTPGSPASTPNNTALTHVSSQGWGKGAAYFSRLEGQIYSPEDETIYFTSTNGGGEPEVGTKAGPYGNGIGQVWAYDPEEETLRVVFQSTDDMKLELPDNITTSSGGTLVVCEDGPADNYLRGLTPDGRIFDIGLNRLRSSGGTERFGDEFAGSTFSPDGHTLFVNIQSTNGMTFAIWGPWDELEGFDDDGDDDEDDDRDDD